MSLKATVTFINGTDEAEAGISQFIDIAVKRAAKITARHVMDGSRHLFHWRTGNLARSIQARDIKPGQSEVAVAQIAGGEDVSYAIHLEYGTKYIAPRAFMRKGVTASQQDIDRIFKEEAEKVKITIN